VKAYLAAPMFSEAEKTFNLTLDATFRSAGLDTYLPQRDGGEAASLVRDGHDEDTVRRRIFAADCAAIRTCDVFVFVLDGRVPDEGGCVELGMASALGKPCFGLQTDCRRFGGTDSNNLMVDHALDQGIWPSVNELAAAVRAFAEQAGRPIRGAAAEPCRHQQERSSS
jgi:nucleoside 2-deoxyribosyltransferase